MGSGGCEPRLEEIIKLKKSRSAGGGPVGGQVGVGVCRGFGKCEPKIESIVKRT